jgi:stage III sporulation protein SpoIIIAA
MDFAGSVIFNVFPSRVRKIIRSIPSRDNVKIVIYRFTINRAWTREKKMAASSLASQSIKDKRKNNWLLLHYHHTDHEGEKKTIIDSELG